MSQKKGKKKGRRKDDDWEDDVANELEQMQLNETNDLHSENSEHDTEKSKKKKKKSRGEDAIVFDQKNDDVLEKDNALKSGFGLLDVQDINDDDDEVDEDDTNEIKEVRLERKKEKRTKKGKLEAEPKGKTEEVVKDNDNDTNDSMGVVNDKQDDGDEFKLKKQKRKSKKDKAKTDVEEEQDLNLEEDSTMKTAAQKRAEKKERDKKKKETQKKKAKDTKSNKKETEKSESREAEHVQVAEVTEENKEKADNQNEESVEVGKNLEEAAGEGTSEQKDDGDEEKDGDEGDEKKKKKKKKKKVKEEEGPKTKKPAKAVIKQMQEALEKAKLEQERLRQEEEAKQKALEEAENKRLEKLRLEQERKERQKLKEKERKQRLKQEGKFLTKAQKQQKAQAEAMLQAMREQGVEIPNRISTDQTDVKKPVRYGKKKGKQLQEKNELGDAEQEKIVEDTTTQPDDDDKETKEECVQEENVEPDKDDEVKDTWDDDDEGNNEETEKENAVTRNEKDIEETVEDEEEESSEEEVSEENDKEESGEDENTSEGKSESDSEIDSDEDESLTKEEREFVRAKARIAKRREKAEKLRSKDKLRSPVICVMGHVDTGKTKILDKIRHTNVQDGEAGGITQQIGATNVPSDAIKQQTKMIKDFVNVEMKIPALLIIDTPGHESFSNLRSRGSTLCDMAILVVDIMHGLEPQTIESINLLRKKKTPFVVALNKVDRLFEWKRGPNSSIVDTLKKQNRNTKQEFEERLNQIIGEFAQEGLNAVLFNKNVDTKSYISLVPTSAHSGDGMGDLIALLVTLCQTKLAHRLSFSEEIQCTVLEVKAITGLGTTVDVILTNGRLRESQTVVLGGIDGAIVTQVRALLMPQPLKELRVKNQYATFKEIEAAQGVKITGKELDKALAGSPLFVAYQEDEIEVLKKEVTSIVQQSLKSIKVSERGVCVQASTLGSLEALLEFLKTSKIPYCSVSIGPVHKKDVMKASVMLEHDEQFSVILAFDVKVERDAQDLADNLGVKIFTADIIYHLFDKFTNFREDLKQKKRDQFKQIAIFPCKLRILSEHIYNSRDPIVVGVSIEAGIVKEGTPVCVPSKEFVDVGIVTGIEANHKQLETATKGMEVCLKIEPIPGEAPKMYGRHFDYTDLIVSKISRESIDAVKEYFRDDLQKTDWQLMIELKKLFKII